jgi:hypothetical protein
MDLLRFILGLLGRFELSSLRPLMLWIVPLWKFLSKSFPAFVDGISDPTLTFVDASANGDTSIRD